MENRKPFQLRKVLIVYNAIQVVFSAWLFYEVSLTVDDDRHNGGYRLMDVVIRINHVSFVFLFLQACAAGWATHYSFRCQPVDYSRSPTAMRVG